MEGDKRRFMRFPLKMRAALYMGKELYEVDRISNLSIGGCLLPIHAVLTPDTPCSMIIKLGMDETELKIRAEGKVIRSDHGEIAIKFISIDPDSLFHLQMLARYNSPEPERIEDEIKKHPGIL
jgi:hypothetical protein